ncbi:MAG: hemerythrin domain-containing protein [Syntrophobacteraceae bacterium]|jgi:hemerythrin-like domain-containing protein
MFSKNPLSRRSFIALAGATGTGVLAGCAKPDKPPEDAATAIEILARQHGVIRRAVAILEEIKGGMDALMDLPPEIIGGTVEIVRLFVIAHHQQMEEKHIYPVFDVAGKMIGVVGVLREQHAAASQLVEILRGIYRGFSVKDLEKRRAMGSAIHLFSRMYRAHAVREDTALFTLLRRMMTPKAYAELSSGIQRAEAEFLGLDGFDETIRKLTDYENILGIGDLASFTPNPEELS